MINAALVLRMLFVSVKAVNGNFKLRKWSKLNLIHKHKIFDLHNLSVGQVVLYPNILRKFDHNVPENNWKLVMF